MTIPNVSVTLSTKVTAALLYDPQELLVGSHPDSHAECCFAEAIVGGDIQAIGRSHDIEHLALLANRTDLLPQCTCFRS